MENIVKIGLSEKSENYLLLEANKLNDEIASLHSEIRLREKDVMDVTNLFI